MFLPPEEIKLLESYLSQPLLGISFLDFQDQQFEKQLFDQKPFYGMSAGCALKFDTGMMCVGWQEDELGDPDRVIAFDALLLNPDKLAQHPVTKEEPWKQFINQKLVSFTVLTYTSHFEQHGKEGDYQVPWGIEFIFTSGSLLAASLSVEDPLHKGTQREIIVSGDKDFITVEKERLAEFYGFYKEMKL